MIRAVKLYAGYMQARRLRGYPQKKHNTGHRRHAPMCDRKDFSFWIALYSKTFKVVQSFLYASRTRFDVKSSERETKARRSLCSKAGQAAAFVLPSCHCSYSTPFQEQTATRRLFGEGLPVGELCRWCNVTLQNGRCNSGCVQPKVTMFHIDGCKPVTIYRRGCHGDVFSRVVLLIKEIPNSIIAWVFKKTLGGFTELKMNRRGLRYKIWKYTANLFEYYRRIINKRRPGITNDKPMNNDIFTAAF